MFARARCLNPKLEPKTQDLTRIATDTTQAYGGRQGSGACEGGWCHPAVERRAQGYRLMTVFVVAAG